MKKRMKMAASCLAAVAVISCMSLFGSTAYAVDSGLLKAIDNTVTLDGTNPASVTVLLEGTGQQNIYAVEGNWNTAEQENTGYFTLDSIESDIMTFSDFNYVDVPTGKVLWTDDTFDHPGVLTDKAVFLRATYTVAADTPTGEYTVGFRCDVIAGSDYDADETGYYYNATISVTNDDAAPHTHSMTKTAAKEATCAAAGNNEYWTCSDCKRVFKDKAGTQATSVSAETIDKLSTHTWGEWVEDSGKNVKTRECTVCHKSESQNLDGSQPDPVEPSGIAFTDVTRGAYYFTPVEWAVGNGITSGTSATTFSPDAACTRAQAVVFLWRAAGSPAPKSGVMPFADVAAGAYYHDAVLWAVENGITSGTSATTFGPNATCTRAQIVTFLWRAQGTPAAYGLNPFADVAAAAYYNNPVLWAVENGVTSGTSATTFSPNANCTRAQIVTFLYRSYNG